MKNLPFFEIALWIGCAFFASSAVDDRIEDAVTLCGIFALSAIGVRATRPQPVASSDDHE